MILPSTFRCHCLFGSLSLSERNHRGCCLIPTVICLLMWGKQSSWVSVKWCRVTNKSFSLFSKSNWLFLHDTQSTIGLGLVKLETTCEAQIASLCLIRLLICVCVWWQPSQILIKRNISERRSWFYIGFQCCLDVRCVCRVKANKSMCSDKMTEIKSDHKTWFSSVRIKLQ